MAGFASKPIPTYEKYVKDIHGVLEVVEDSATNIIWTVEAAQFVRADLKSAPFKVGDTSLHLHIDSDDSQFVILRVCLVDNTTVPLKCALFLTAGDTIGGVLRETNDFSKSPRAFAFRWDPDEFRLLFGGSGAVRLVVTFFPEHSRYLERPAVERGIGACERHPSTDEDCRGELIQKTCPGIAVVWTADFLVIGVKESDNFYLMEAAFELRIWTHISDTCVKLKRVEGGATPFLISFVLTVKTTAKETLLHRVIHRFDFRANGYYACTIMDRLALIQRLGDDKKLTIVCSLFQDDDNAGSNSPTTHSSRGLHSLSRDFKELFITRQDSDITVEVEGEKFQVHKAILGIRCPVFSNMLKHDMAEKNTGKLQISGFSAGDFKDFLLYLYTGEVESFTTEKALTLYSAADQYDVPDLKADSLDFMKKNLSADTLGDVIVLSHVYDEKELLELANQFFTKNFRSVIRTNSWKMFWKENFEEANEMYIKAADAMVPKSET